MSVAFNLLKGAGNSMRNLVVTALLVCSSLAFAQEEIPPPAVVVQSPPAAVPSRADWNLGAGLGFSFGTIGLSSGPIGLAGLAGAGGLASLGLSVAPSPRATLLLERRLSERLFLSFNAGAGYSASQSATFSGLSYRTLSLEGSLGLRRLFNPGGIIEVSAFGAAGVNYGNFESRSVISTSDGMGGTTSAPQTYRGNSFTVGAVAGLTLERELITGLALRLSSSILGFSYGGSRYTLLIADTSTESAGDQIDVGLRFNPAIELRYAF